MSLSIYKKCPECGFENPETAKFCNECGFKLIVSESASPIEPGKADGPAASPPAEPADKAASPPSEIPPEPAASIDVPASPHLLPPAPALIPKEAPAVPPEAPVIPSPTPSEPASHPAGAEVPPESESADMTKPVAPFGERFKIIEELGQGSLGTVYKVFDKAMERELALKSIKPEVIEKKDALAGFSQEMKVERGIVHKNIARLFELNALLETPFITMEYVPGRDLKSMIQEKKRLTVEEALAIARQIFNGLSEAHRQGALHLDLRSDNIMIDQEGTAKIMDLGIARMFRLKGIARGVAGMPQYLSPEQMEGQEADAGSDIYAAGVILYEMLTGSLPLVGQPLRPPRGINRGIPNKLNLLVIKCLEKDKEARYKTAQAVYEELEQMEADDSRETAHEPAEPPAEQPPVPAKKEKPSLPAPQIRSEIPARAERKTPRKKRKTGLIIPRKYGLPALLALAAVILVALLWRVVFKSSEGPPAAEGPARISLAVLPFEDLDPDRGKQYLGVAAAEMVARTLKKASGLRVLDQESAFSFKDTGGDGRSIMKPLGIDRFLDGSFQIQESHLRVEARLVDVDSGAVLWTSRYEREEADLSAIAAEIGRAVTQAAGLVRPTERPSATGESDVSPHFGAVDAYAQARWLAGKGGASDLEKAAEHLEKAATEEPRFALAFAGLAEIYFRLADGRHWPPERALPKAKAAALNAMLIDPHLAEAHVALGKVRMVAEWDFAGAEKEFREALRLDPDCSQAHQFLASLLSTLGRNREAIDKIQAAQALNPRSSAVNAKAGEIFFLARFYEEADAEIKKAMATDPSYHGHFHNAALLQIHRARFEDAILSLARARDLGADPREIDLLLAHIYARQGRRADVGRILTTAIQEAKNNGVQQVSIASAYAGLNDREQVIACLEIAYSKREPGLLLLKVNPMFDFVRGDPRFTNLLQKIGLAN